MSGIEKPILLKQIMEVLKIEEFVGSNEENHKKQKSLLEMERIQDK